ncbi:hypothetical protein [Nosocomiicoccus massiliensis]|uniref:hypothetical protein n=1 Tax=Nosocomiicoccus massiliensis TaxID=1232430 RepID=UPI00040EF47B|nr:hypothetical protein [Nosocomiicoccus massiliensis]
MFEYQRLYWNHLRGEHLKVVLNIVLYVIFSSIVSIIGIGLGFAVIGGTIFSWTSAQSGPGALGIIGIILAVLYLFALVIFVLLLLGYGYYNYFFLAYEEKESKFNHGLFAFKKERYLKSLGLVIIISIIAFATNFALSFVGVPLNLMVDPNTLTSGDYSINFTPAIIVFAIIGAIISMLVSFLIEGITLSMWFRHLEAPLSTLGDKVATGTNVVFKNFKQFLKLILSVFLIGVLLTIVIAVLIISGVAIGVATNSDAVMFFVVPIIIIVSIVIGLLGTYLIYGSYVTFYKENRARLNLDDEIEYIEA